MKKFYFWYLLTLIIMVVFLPQVANAQQNRTQQETSSHVTAQQAMDIGYAFMHTGKGSKGNGTKSGAVRKQAMQLVYTGRATDTLTRTMTDCYYVFALQPKGFVIVAADERVEPILGYSYDNNFVVENMPEHVRSWLGNYERQIEAVAKSDQEADPVAKDKWMALKLGQPMNSAKNGTTVGPLLTTTWNQGQYYNNLCPSDAYGPAGHVYTGCVATAMAQIIHYWGYPTQGRGIHSYESNYGTLTVNYGSTNYNYTLMPDALTSASTSQEVEAVATLIRDCGVAVNMGYSPMESSSFDQDARAALINFFHYSPNLSFAEKAYFSESDWDAMLHNDLDNGRPIFYSGQGSGGHAFVCDGYNADGYYHFNFGWGGFADGWFLTSSVTPGSSNFSSSQAALFGIVPDSTGHVILGQTEGTSTFIVDEPLEFYHLMGHNTYEGGNYYNSCNNTVNFIPANSTNQIVADILDYEDQTLTFSDGNGNQLRSLVGGNDNDYSPVVSSYNSLNISYSGNMYYAGFKLNISQTDNNGCRMVSNITSFVEAQTVHLTWTENGMASQWEIEYGVKGFALGTGTTYTATANTATFNNLSKFTEYDFYIRPVCGVGQYGLHNKISVMVEAEYWQDIVTSQPAGYVYNAQTNSIEISTAEGLAWWAKNVSFSHANPKVYLTADINLSGHKWRPAEMFYQVFDGQGHQITNAYIREIGNYIGFFSMIDNGSVENLGLTDSYIKGNGSCGGICGYNFGGMMRNSYVSNSTVDGSDAFMVGGLIGQHQGGVINCFVNAYVIGNHWNGLMIGSSLNNASVKNCYAAGTMKYLSWCNMGGIAAVSSEVTNCYSVWTSGGVVGNTIGPIADTSTFVKTNNGCVLLTPIDFDGVIETDLLSALNRGLVLYNDSSCLTWAADTGNVNGGFPVFGSNHYIVQCKDVSDVSVEQVFVNNNYGVKVSWTENGDANQWRIRYRQHDRPDTAYTIITTSNNPDTIYGMSLRNTYDFNVHAVCNNNSRSAWSETQSLVVDLPFWTDIVTTQPTGYVEDADGNVEIYSAEGLAWLSVITHGLHNQSQSSFEEKIVTLKSDIDLDGYRWYPIGNERWWDGLAGVFRGGFSGTFDGQNHSISNIYINGASGLFGLLHLGSVKNVILDGGTIIGGNGGLIGTAMDCYEIFNCHSSATVYGGGSLCGGISNNGNGPSKITVSNCSSSGMVYGQEGCGSLIGTVAAYDGDIVVRNCYSTGNVEGSQYFIGGLIGYIRGAKIYNCFSTGHVEFNPDYRIGNVIGCQDLGAEGEYIYGQDNVNAGVALIGCSGNYPNTSLFHHEGNTNTLLSSVSINGETPNNLLDALNTWVISQNDPTLRTWVLDTLTGYPIFGDYFVPSCYNPSDLTVSQATVVGNDTIKTRLEWVQEGNPDHWEILYVANGNNIDLGTIVSVNSTPCVLSDIPVGQALDFYVRAVCDEENISDWCGPFTYIPDILRWTEVVTSKPEGFHRGADGNIYISSAEGLSWLSSVTNGLNGAQEDNLYDKQIFLTNDIDLSGYRWTPITVYALSFNGNNHVISGLYCNEFAGYQGLFGSMSWGNISNIVLSQCNVHGKRTMTGNGTSGSIGGIVGYASPGNIVNCIVTGNVNGGGIAGTLVGSSSGEFNIENCCFIGNDIFDGQSVGICESPLFAGVVNCYVVNSQNRYYIGEAGNSDFTGSGNTWTLSTPPYINGAFRSDLVDALNAWVDVNNTDGQYRYWVADTNMVNGGYPVFKTPPVFVQDTVMVAGYYSWHGRVFVSDTVVTDTLSSFNGYDSIVTYHIFVTPTPRTILTIDTCVSYILNGQAYYETGDYVQTFPAAYGGDSLVVLYLTIHQPTSGVDVQTACGSFTWIDGITYTENNNTATYTLTNVAGCDSIVTLKLTIGHPNSGDTTAIACDYFDWYEHNNLTENGDYTQTFTNKFGCDSVVTLHLTINHSNTGDTTAIVCDSFDWYEYSNLTQSGDYTRILTNANGCDSVVTLHLTINHSTSSDTTAVACNSFDWYEYTNLTQSGDYTRMLMNANGCDSVVTLHLSVITPPTVTTNTVSDITASSALCGGNVTDDGGVEVTERGVCWSTSQNPTIADSHIAIGMGIGPFTVNITDLTLYITYHVRAYATNSAGTAYGEDVTFTTTETPSTYSCGDNLIVGGNIYTTNLYGSQCWMTRNLRNANGGFQFEYPDVLQACPTGWHLPSESDWSLLGSNLPFSPVYFDDGDYWTSTLMIWQGNEGNQFTLISPPYVQSNNVTYTGSACEVHDAAQGNCVIHTPLSVRCLRDENAFATLPIVKTDTVINNTATSAICVGKVTADGGTEVTERGICWSTSANPTIVTAGAGTGTFTINLTDLTPNTTYHVRAFATNSAGTAYGDEVTFTTGCNPMNVAITSDKIAICEGECATLYAFGADNYIWSTGENSSIITDCPTITTTYSVTGFNIFGCESTTSFALMVIDLPATPLVTVDNATVCDGGSVTLSVTNPDSAPSTSYAWYRNGVVIPNATQAVIVDYPTTVDNEITNNVYTVVASHNNSGCVSNISEPYIVTVNVTNNTELIETACDSYEWNDSVYTESGNYMRTSTNASGCDSVVTLHLTINHPVVKYVEAIVYDSYIWDDDTLTESGEYNQTYTASNGCDSVVTLHLTVNYSTLPTVTTSPVSDISAFTAICGGTVTADGGAEVTERGVCWSTSQEPTISDVHTIDGSGASAFTSQLIGLEPNTTYYVRAYATNSKGTAYGEEQMFTTSLFTCGDNLFAGSNSYTTNQYGSQCWMTQNLRNETGTEHIYWPDVLQACPTGWHLPSQDEWCILGDYINNNNASSALVDFGNGDFWTSSTMQMDQWTMIIFPTVHSNNVSCSNYVGYDVYDAGDYLSVRCLKNLVTLSSVTTDTVINITATTATGGGNVTDDGGADVTERGVCWSTSVNPTIIDNHTSDGMGTGAFTSNLTNLTSNTTYYVRAYATNSEGTAYGAEVMFTTTDGGVDTGNVEVSVGPLFEFREINGTESIRSMEANQGEQSKFEMYLYDNSTSPAEPNDKVFIDFQIYKDGVPMSNAELAEAMDDYVGSYKMLYVFDLSVGAAALSNMTMQSAANVANGFFPNNEISSGMMPYYYDWFYMHFLLGPENQDNGHNGRKITVNTGTWKPGSSGVYTFSYAVIKAGDFTSNNSIIYNSTKRLGGYGSHNRLTVKDTIVADFFTIYVGDNTGGGSDTTDACLTLPTATVDGPDFSCYGDANSTISVNITDADVYFREWSYIGSAQEGLIDKYSESISLNGFSAGTHIFGANIFDTITHCTNTIYDTVRVVSVNAEVRVEPTGAVCENDTVKAYCSYFQQDETDTIINYYWFNGNHVENVSPSVYDTVWVVPTLYASNISLLVMDNHGCTGAFGRSINVVACATLPTVTTDAVSNILATTATCGGNVSDDGGATVAEFGVCWSTSPNPTVDDSHTSDGTGMGAFMSSLTNLTSNTTYYVRAYATNSEGTAYGKEVMFTTLSCPEPLTIDTSVCDSELPLTWFGHYFNGPETYTMTYQTATGCDSVVTLILIVNDAPATPIVTVDNNVICDGGDVTLSITNPDPNPLVLYTWYRNGVIIPGATHSNFVDMPTTIGGETANYTYNVVATYFNSGCYSSSSALTVTVNDVPATPVLAVDNANVFEGAQVTVSVTNPIADATYIWYKNGVIIEDATQAVFVDYLTAIDGETNYAYNVVAVLPISGCVSDISASTMVTVNALPTATVTVEGNTVLCNGGSTTLHVDVTPNDNSTYVYQWYEDGMLISGATSADYVVVKPIRDYPYNFMVVVSAMNGGFNITAHAPAITVAPAPMVTAFISDTVICEGGTVSMTAWVDGNNSGEGYNLQWFRETSGLLTAEPVGTDITYTTTGNELAGSYIYWLEVTNEYGCSSQSDPVMLTINQPTTGIDVQTVCGSYTWIDGITYTESNNTATYTLTNAVGCDSVVTLHLTVNDTPPTPVVTVDNANVFEGAQLTVSVTNPIDGAVYTWYRNGVILEGATQAVFMDTPTTIDGGTAYYTYSVFAVLPTSGCVSNISSSTMVMVNPLPVVTVTVEGNTVLCEGSSVTLHADVAPYNDPTYVYQWYEDGVPIPGATSADYVVLEPARTNPYNFMVMVSGMNGSFNITANAPAITVVPSPTVVASISESTICVGGTATLTATVEGGVAGINGYNFQWYGIAETSMPWPEVVGTGSSYTTSGDEPAGNYPYWVMVSDEYGCNSQSGMVILAVVSQPAVTITRTVGYGEMVCEGGSTAIQANVTGGYGELSYQWYANGYILADETNQSLAINNLSYGVNDTYTVVVAQTGAGCSNSTSADINTLVSVYPSYTVAVSGPNDICEGGDLTMFAEVNNVIPGDMLSYQWHEIISGQDLLIEGANSIMYTAVDLQSGSLYEYYVVVNSNLSGCTATSSVHVVNVNALSYTNLYETSCEYYTWNDMTYSASGEYTQTFTNSAGCDSIVTLHLTVNTSTEGDTTATVCGSFSWYEYFDLTQSGDYTHMLTNSAGCDSVVTLHLTVNTPTEGDTTAIVCGSFSWYEYFDLAQSGDYTHTLTNAAGCDSVVTLHLTVNTPTEGDTTAIVCGSFSWYEYSDLTQSGDYTHTLTNSAGCDSIVTLHLTVNTPTEGDTTAIVCGSFSWYEYSDLTQSGDYTHTLTNAAGCDSVVTLHLTVNTPTEGDTTAIVYGSFSWYEYSDLTQSGDYTHTLTNSAGCDSIVTLHLTVNAQWQVDSYDLNVNQVTGGTITMTVSYVDETSPGTVNSFSTTTDTSAIFESWIQLSADADYGYDFVDFLVITSSGDTLETPNNGFTMPAENVTVTAVFTLHNFNITVNVGDETPWGTVTGSGIFAYGSTDTLTATPMDEHHIFVGWSDYNTENPRVITVTHDSTITAYFVPEEIEIIGNDTVMGSVSVNIPGGGHLTPSTPIVITATPEPHYHFVSWSDGNTDNPRTIFPIQAIGLTAVFAIDQHTITVLSNDYTWGEVIGGGIYDYGTEISICANALAGYEFLSWGDGNTDNPRHITVEQDSAFTAIFQLADGINVANMSKVTVYSYTNQIVVVNAEGFSVEIFDMSGRLLVIEQNVSQSVRKYTIATDGIYLVKVGKNVFKKVKISR